MDRKRLFIFLGILIILALIGFLCYQTFEIYPKKVPTPPLREVRGNNFAALEAWLKSTGRNTRIEKRINPGQIVSAPENTVLVFTSFCPWKNAGETLLPWIESGANLILCVDDWDDETDDLGIFISALGIIINEPVAKAEISEEEDGDELDETDDTDAADNDESGSAAIDLNEIIETLTDEKKDSPEILFPTFDWNIRISIADNVDQNQYRIVKNAYENIKFVQINYGAGTICVTGRPFFMYNYQIKKEINARLAWTITGERMEEGSGLLIVKDRKTSRGLFGKIAERGNFPPLIISCILLIVAGFWMLIPLNGTVNKEKKFSSRPLKQRFLAEIRFLKKYNALETYLHTYLSYLKHGIEFDSYKAEIESIEKVIQNNKTSEGGIKPLKYRELMKLLAELQQISEKKGKNY